MMTPVRLIALIITISSVAAAQSDKSSVEHIIIARSVRESRTDKSLWCGVPEVQFNNIKYEDRYALRSMQIRESDGVVVNTSSKQIGVLRGCFGATSDDNISNFYATGTLSGVTFVGRGQCVRHRQDYPEKGVVLIRCFLDLSDLPAPYVGGLLTTSTVNTRAIIGELSDPPGYTQPSVATIRLWTRP